MDFASKGLSLKNLITYHQRRNNPSNPRKRVSFLLSVIAHSSLL
nr:MAG TPA: hypothetical protein [Caudoviricetes sp.]